MALAPSAMATMRVDQMPGEAVAAEVDAYIRSRTFTALDLPGWRRVLQQVYGMRSTVLTANDGSVVLGALILHEIRHPLFGRYLTTAAFGTDGGFWFETDQARDALVRAAGEMAHRLRVDFLVIRTRDAPLAGCRVDTRYLTAWLDLTGGPDRCWDRLPGKTRNQVRRGRKEGFSLGRGPGELEGFFDVFHRHMRDLGSPAHGRAFYRAIRSHLGEQSTFYVVRDGEHVVSGALLLQVNRTAMNLHTVSLRRYNRRCPNYLLYWTMIEDSSRAGCEWLDMGRSEVGSPQLDFKRNWQPELQPLYYNYMLVRARDTPRLDPRNPKFRLAIAAWRRLPLALTRILGPHLISGLA